MPTKKKYNARFPPARIKKIMQTDEDIGKVAAPVPVILSKALEIFMQSLLETACKNTQARHAKTMSTAHLKQCITAETQFDFLKELVDNIPDLPANEEDADDFDDQPKPKRKKASTSGPPKPKAPRRSAKKKERETVVQSESDEDSHSEEEDGSNSTGSYNTHSDVSNSCSTFTPSSSKEQNTHSIPTASPLQPSSSSSSLMPPTLLQIPKPSIPVPSLYRPIHSEDDDYDS